MDPVLADEDDEDGAVDVDVVTEIEFEFDGLDVEEVGVADVWVFAFEEPATMREIPVNGAETVVRMSRSGKKIYLLPHCSEWTC